MESKEPKRERERQRNPFFGGPRHPPQRGPALRGPGGLLAGKLPETLRDPRNSGLSRDSRDSMKFDEIHESM